MEKDRFAVFGGEFSQCLPHEDAFNHSAVLRRGRGKFIGAFQRFVYAPGTQPVRVFVVSDAVKPGFKGGVAPEGAHRPPCLKKGLLREVFRIFGAAREVKEELVNSGVMDRDEAIRHLQIARKDALYQLFITHRPTSLLPVALS